MTTSATGSQPTSVECSRPTVCDASSASLQRPKFTLKRSIKPPPRRLDFEPITTAPFTAKRRNNTYGSSGSNNGGIAPLQQAPLATKKIPQGCIQANSQAPSKEFSMVSQEREPTCQKLPRDATHVRGVVYMLHGWAQNVHVFSNRARKLTKRLNKAGYKVVFLQGPHRLPMVESPSASAGSTTFTEEQSQQQKGRSGDGKDGPSFSREHAYAWFFYDTPCDGDEDRNYPSDNYQPLVLQPSLTGNFPGMAASLSFLRNELRADRAEFCKKRVRTNQDVADTVIPPFFLLGFSQGGVLVHKIATLACGIDSSDACDFARVAEIDKSGCCSGDPWISIQKCILVSGFSFTTSIRRNKNTGIHKSRGDDHLRTKIIESSGSSSRRRTMPSFHVIGKKDNRVNPHLTAELYSLEPCFNQSDKRKKILWEHDRGHVLPQDRAFCDRLLEFLAEP